MNDCCNNGSSDQKECCKAAVEAYKQELAKQQEAAEAAEALIQAQEERADMIRSAWNQVIGFAVLIVLTLIVSDAPAPWGLSRIFSVPMVILFCFLLWRARKDLKTLEKEPTDEHK